jgi:hypothetical protein
MEREVFYGGVTSSFLTRKWSGAYGIFVTNQRIIGIGTYRVSVFGITGVSSLFVALALVYPSLVVASFVLYLVLLRLVLTLAAKTLRSLTSKTLEEIEDKRHFEISRHEIGLLETKKPNKWVAPVLGVRPGYLTITPRFGKYVRIDILRRKTYEEIRELIQQFAKEEPMVSLIDREPRN